MATVLAFGTFDGLHEGHRAFLRQARERGDHLIVAVARDEVVEKLKKRRPRKNLRERMDALRAEKVGDEPTDGPLVGLVVEGDAELGSYGVIKAHRPDIIVLGYDQEQLKNDLAGRLKDFDWGIKIVTLDPHEPEKYKSSLLV